MLIGYARVSTGDQSLTLQLDTLEEAGCERIFQDQVSGIVNTRPDLNQALKFRSVWKHLSSMETGSPK